MRACIRERKRRVKGNERQGQVKERKKERQKERGKKGKREAIEKRNVVLRTTCETELKCRKERNVWKSVR